MAKLLSTRDKALSAAKELFRLLARAHIPQVTLETLPATGTQLITIGSIIDKTDQPVTVSIAPDGKILGDLGQTQDAADIVFGNVMETPQLIATIAERIKYNGIKQGVVPN